MSKRKRRKRAGGSPPPSPKPPIQPNRAGARGQALEAIEARGELAFKMMQAKVDRSERAARIKRRPSRRRRIAFAISAAVLQLLAFIFARTAEHRIRRAEDDAYLHGQ